MTQINIWMPPFFNASAICQQAEKRRGLRFPEALAAERHGGGEHHLWAAHDQTKVRAEDDKKAENI